MFRIPKCVLLQNISHRLYVVGMAIEHYWISPNVCISHSHSLKWTSSFTHPECIKTKTRDYVALLSHVEKGIRYILRVIRGSAYFLIFQPGHLISRYKSPSDVKLRGNDLWASMWFISLCFVLKLQFMNNRHLTPVYSLSCFQNSVRIMCCHSDVCSAVMCESNFGIWCHEKKNIWKK